MEIASCAQHPNPKESRGRHHVSIQEITPSASKIAQNSRFASDIGPDRPNFGRGGLGRGGGVAGEEGQSMWASEVMLSM